MNERKISDNASCFLIISFGELLYDKRDFDT